MKGEIDDNLPRGDQWLKLGHDGLILCSQPQPFPQILTDRGMPFLFQSPADDHIRTSWIS